MTYWKQKFEKLLDEEEERWENYKPKLIKLITKFKLSDDQIKEIIMNRSKHRNLLLKAREVGMLQDKLEKIKYSL